MRAVVVGANWGLVHVYALRAAGVEVIGLAGRNQDELSGLALQHEIPHVLDSYPAIRELAPDLVTLATPAAAHLEGLQALRDMAVICEKPLFGAQGGEEALQALGNTLWVNYAFAFLQPAQQLLSLRGRLGRVHAVEMTCEYELPRTFSVQQGWFEVGSHPLSFLTLLCGEPRWDAHCRRDGDVLHCSLGGIPAQLQCKERSGQQGIAQQLRLHTDAGLVELSGAFRNGQPWHYAPLRLAGSELCPATRLGEDAWIQANQRCIATMVRHLAGELSYLQAVQAGLFPASRAWPIDRLLIEAWR
ncbi:Gfo/Idh/MocA family protein [Pseudaeromonas sharmana]|uniref:Gfo/Idh/MocA family protein n=1 Tax=Pseudaeromonas sharmana TaxID=328412 RepID=A0ABV8CRF9_9GAMM